MVRRSITLLLLTDDDLAGFVGFGDLIGTAHLRVADSAQDEDDEAGAAPVVVRARLMLLLPCAEKKKRMI